jgi:competence protein ComEC
LGRVAGWTGVLLAAGFGTVGVVWNRRGGVLVLVACLVGGSVSGTLASTDERDTLAAPVPNGPVRVAGWAIDDVRPGRNGDWFLLQPTHLHQEATWLEWRGPPLLIGLRDPVDVASHEYVQVDGMASSSGGYARGHAYAGRITAGRVMPVGPAGDPFFRAGNAVRDRVATGLNTYGEQPAAALVSGFLIGDVRNLPPLEAEQLRSAGLSHFVAVSGSNVAVFLVLWWVVTGPLAMGPRRRALAGIVGLALFAVITRWEPSVLRAASMAGLVLLGRTFGVALSPWAALGASVGGVLLVAGELSADVGFQLSVAATVGVIAGADIFGFAKARWLAGSLGVTTGAQVAVAPLLLFPFGSVPLVSPLANLVAAPLVLASTVSGGLGVLIGMRPLTDLAVEAADLVLGVARLVAPWPQLEPSSLGLAAVVLGAALWRPLRAVAALAGACFLAFIVFAPSSPVHGAAVVVLDVGQGDAILVRGAAGETVLVDGGPDPVLLLRKLRRFGVNRVDLAVLSHPHADHVSGMVAALQDVQVGRLWHPGFVDGGPVFEELLHLADSRGIGVDVPTAGWNADIGSIHLEVLGPVRRYASPNDQSLVILATVRGRSVLLPGDIEVIAQRELGTVHADVLKVPHQGAATSDLVWLSEVGATTAIISVGPNTFGHPSAEVVAALEDAGVDVLRTDRDGDVIIQLAP